MARLFSFKPALSIGGRRFRGVRGWAGKPSHPPLTDIPIACYILVAVFDVLSYVTYGEGTDAGFSHDAFVAGTFVIISGAIVSLGTITTGFFDWWKGLPRRKTGPIGQAHHTQVWRTVNTHAAVMVTVTVLVVIDIAVRLAGWDTGHATLGLAVLSALVGLLVVLGAAYGGSLVFDYQFNVEEVSGTTVWDETEVDQTHADRAKKPSA